VLEIDHVIYFVPRREHVDLAGFAIDPGRVHTGQGTRNVRVVFDRNYLEVVWIKHPDDVRARGLDFIGRCARPATAVPFGLVLRGKLASHDGFTPYELPDAPGIFLMTLSPQPADAPFVAVFELDGLANRLRGAAAHPCGATRIERVVFTTPVAPALPEIAGVSFEVGAPRLALELGGCTRQFDAT
jgi:hypothetical protein